MGMIVYPIRQQQARPIAADGSMKVENPLMMAHNRYGSRFPRVLNFWQQGKHKKGTTLILSVTILSLLSLLGVAFVRISQSSASVAKNVVEMTQAKYIALAGIEYCTAKLRESASQKDYVFNDWECQDPISTPLTLLKYPSYCHSDGGKYAVPPPTGNYTGTITMAQGTNQEETSFYICRITDNSGKINVKYTEGNTLSAALSSLAEVLDISLKEDIIKEIIKHQPEYVTLDDVPRLCEIEEKLWQELAPYVCIESYEEKVYVPALSKNELSILPSVNINVAAREVLLAIWTCNTAKTPKGKAYGFGKAKEKKLNKFVENFIEARPFKNWSDLSAFVQDKKNGLKEDEAALMWASICPLWISQEYNPAAHSTWEADRSMLQQSTIPCTLYPGGIFTIESLGLYIHNQQLRSRYQITVTIKIYSQFVHKTQEDFHKNWTQPHSTHLVQAATGPHPVGYEVAKLYGQDDIYERTISGNGATPSSLMGWVERANGANNEANLHDTTFEMPNQPYLSSEELINYYDGKPGPAYLDPPLTEAPRGVKVSLDFYFKPSLKFGKEDDGEKDKKEPTAIFRNFSMDEGIATEIYWDPEIKKLRAARTLCCSKEPKIQDPDPRKEKRYIYRGLLNPKGFEEIAKLGLEIYHENLDSWNIPLTPVGSISYSEVADPNSAGSFGNALATKIYRSIAAGLPPDQNLTVPMQFSKLWVTVVFVPIILPPFLVPVPIPVITGGHERKLQFCLEDYLDLVFLDGPEIYTIDRPSDQLSLRNVALDLIPPITHTSPVSRTEFQIDQQLKPGQWYRFRMVWDDLEVLQFSIASANGSVNGQDERNMSDTPLNIWRVTDLTLEHQTEFGASGTYVFANATDLSRFKNSFYQGKFDLPDNVHNPQLANMAVTAFFPTPIGKGAKPTVYPCIYNPKTKEWQPNISIHGGIVKDITNLVFSDKRLDYMLILGGDMYQTPTVFETRIRLLHWPQWRDIKP